MTVDPADLTPEVKQALLQRLREQVGEAQYHELTSRASEDQILEAMLRQAQSPSGTRERPARPGWVLIVGKILLFLIFAGLAWMEGQGTRIGRSMAGAAIGVAFSFGFPGTGFAVGGVIGGVLGGILGKDSEAAFGGAMIGGFAVVLLRLAFEWLAKLAAGVTRNTRY